MFREIRRSKQLLSMEDTKAVMDRRTNCVMACAGDEDYPYAVPVSYLYYNDKIYEISKYSISQNAAYVSCSKA